MPRKDAMTIENFTALPEGHEVPLEGSVVRCPRCGRNGVLERPPECRPYCLHEQQWLLLSDGMLVEPTDSCELPDA
jgi:hypothetical protein